MNIIASDFMCSHFEKKVQVFLTNTPHTVMVKLNKYLALELMCNPRSFRCLALEPKRTWAT